MKTLLLAIALFAFGGTGYGQVLLKQSTASTVQIYLAKTADGTGETGATVTNISLSVIKHSDTTSTTVTTVSCAASGSPNDCVHVAKGAYNVELSAGNTDTLGRMDLCWSHTASYTLCRSFMVVDPASYDANVTGSLASAAGIRAEIDANSTQLAKLGTPSNLGGGATLSANLSDIEGQTDDIGAAGAGLTAINLPNQTMDIVGNITGNLSGSAGSVTGAVGSVTGAVGSVTGAVGSVTGLTASDVGAIKTKTDNLPSDPADESAVQAAIATRSAPALKRATGLTWPVQMFNATTGAVMTSGTPVCTRGLDSAAFGGSLTETALDADGFSFVTLADADMNAADSVRLKCTLASARTYYTLFRIQAP